MKKIKYILEHGRDGWGILAFENGSHYTVTAEVGLTGTNLGRCKWLIFFF
jgi:hypothetical protein